MVGLFSTLSGAAYALDAQGFGMEVTGQNIANVNTEGYARRQAELAERPTPYGMGGVEILGVRSTRDAFIDSRLRNELPSQTFDSTRSDALSVVETTLGSVGSSIDGSLSALFKSFSDLSTNPQSAVYRDGVVQNANKLATSITEMSKSFSASATQADADVRLDVQQINTLSKQISQLNQRIGDSNGTDTSALKDQLSTAVQSLSRLARISVVTQPQGTVDVSLGAGRQLVVATSNYALSISNAPVTGRAQIRYGATDITSEITDGSVGAEIDIRDNVLPSYQQKLDQLAYDLTQQVNAVHATGYDATGAAGGSFFQPIATVSGAAAAFKVAPAIAANSNKIAASGTGAIGNNQTALALSALRDAKVASGGTSTFVESWSVLVGQVGTDAAAAKNSLQTRNGVVSAIQTLADSASGVSLDEEAANLIKFQRAYEANAKFFSAIDSVLTTLMSSVGVA